MKNKYLSDILSLLTIDEIKRSAENPSPVMTKMQIKLHYVALRRLGVKP